MGKTDIRLLRADEIECRVAAINGKGLSLLLFKDARVDQRILDETFTPFGWRRTHQSIDGNLYCTVEVWDAEKGQWIAKQDVGTAGYAEKEKGQASDSFKRACFNWGIGRELYTAPFIWVPAGKAGIQEREGRYVATERFQVRSITYNSQREICALSIINGKGQMVFEQKGKPEENPVETRQGKAAGLAAKAMDKETGKEEGAGKRKLAGTAEEAREEEATRAGIRAQKTEASKTRTEEAAKPVKKAAEKGEISAAQKKALEKELERTGVALETVLGRYNISSFGQMTPEIYRNALNSLKKTKTKEAA